MIKVPRKEAKITVALGDIYLIFVRKSPIDKVC